MRATTGWKRKAAAAAVAIGTAGAGMAWPDITLTLKDGKGDPLAGVACSQAGGPSAVSDASGRLTMANVVGIRGSGAAAGAPSLSRIPLAPGERATLTLTDLRGRIVLSRSLAYGERFTHAGPGAGMYYARVSAPGFSAAGRVADVGGRLAFETVPKAAVAAAKAAAGPEAIISCSKAGYPTQVYKIQDGTTAAFDFSKPNLVPLFDAMTRMEPDVYEMTDTAFITRWSDRGRDRHAREDEFHIYDHYLKLYWEHRTAAFEIIDYVAKGGTRIDFRMTTQWKLNPKTMEFRAFYRGLGTVAEYIHSPNMVEVPGQPFKYTNTIGDYWYLGPGDSHHKRPLKIGDKIELEISQWLNPTGYDGKDLEGRENYYGTAVLYIVGKGFVPFETKGVFKDRTTPMEDSYELPEHTWMGGRTTLPYQYSNEPRFRYMQMAQNLSSLNGQNFVLGRRVLHTDFLDGSHDEPDNPVWSQYAGKGGPHYVNTSCASCHTRNGNSLPPVPGAPLYTSVVKVGDAQGNPLPKVGSVLQPQTTGASPEGVAKLAAWTEADGLRKPSYAFTGGAAPTHFSVRSSPRLVGMGLLEAIPETFVQGLADPDDANQDGISGRMNLVADPATGLPHLGRFGWKAGKASVTHQVAGALNTDMGVMSSVLPKPDCGSEQADCGPSGAEIHDTDLVHLADYIRLLGVAARRDYKDAEALRGEGLFASIGCAACHVSGIKTGAYHPKGELRGQTIHPYTDLLLHDMGPGLADNLPEGLASGSEWRTAPLWSIGLADSVSGGAVGYLHDGRARTLREAILWHGGEAEKSAAKFKALPAADAEAIVRFIKTL